MFLYIKFMDETLYKIKDILLKNNLKLSTAESCTGGLISSYLTDIDGASNFIEQNFVTYAPSAKEKFLNVNSETIKNYGVVSKETAYEMTEGLFQYADCAIATTGYAGTSDDINNPAGTVYIGLGIKNGNIIKTVKYNSKFKERCTIKQDFAKTALKEFLIFLNDNIK